MLIDLAKVILGIILGIGLIVAIASFLQYWLVDRGAFRRKSEVAVESCEPLDPIFSEKLRLHLGKEMPTYDIKKILPVPESQDRVILLDYSLGPFPNLLRCHTDGSLVWQAEQPEKPGDFFVDMEWVNNELRASSWSGFSVVLSPEDGGMLSSAFTK
jgi:hypothetical protein